MKWLYLGMAAAVSVISGLLGLTAGINLNHSSTVTFVPDWGSLADWIAGVSAFFTFVVALKAMSVWRVQERQRLILQWKASLVDYTWTLPYVKEQLSWPDDKADIERMAGKFYECITRYFLMIEYLEPDQKESYKLIWSQAYHAHSGFITKGATKEDTKKAFVAVYSKQLL